MRQYDEEKVRSIGNTMEKITKGEECGNNRKTRNEKSESEKTACHKKACVCLWDAVGGDPAFCSVLCICQSGLISDRFSGSAHGRVGAFEF